MDFKAIQFFLFLYFIRPQDWVPGLAGAHLVAVSMAWAISAAIFRPGGFSVGSLLKTPHDWVMLAYFGWVVGMSPDPSGTFHDAKSLFIFYLVTMLALSSWERIAKLLSLWAVLLVVVAALAVGSLYGIDLTGAAGLTASQRGRLCLGTWMLNNPNALGHTVIVAIPLIYFAFVWKRRGGAMLFAPLLVLVAGSCVYYTQSKGAFLVGASTLAASQIFGRPRITQIILICLAITFGSVAIAQLPRMQTLSRADEGIQGRLLAWQNARETMKTYPNGVGWKNFIAHFRWGKEWQELATHGSYVQIGAALGYGGLGLYLGVLYCCFRTVFRAQTRNDDEERVRRMLFCLLFSFTFSNWMIDRAYHTEFFVMTAAIAAFHRLCLLRKLTPEEEEELAKENNFRIGEARFPEGIAVAGAGGAVGAVALTADGDGIGGRDEAAAALQIASLTERGRGDGEAGGVVSVDEASDAEGEEDQFKPRISWNRIGIIDIAITGLLLWGVLSLWDYIIKNF